MSLAGFLEAKPLFYQRIDYERMPRMWQTLRHNLPNFSVTQLIGTNGKGSTGRFLSQLLAGAGADVAHYTSPHIFKFNERFYRNGKILSDDELDLAHEKLMGILGEDVAKSASYFEYATMLSAVLFSDAQFFICEAGMGGELDATSCFNRRLSLFTPIGLDHISTLGDSIEKIARTKFNAMSGVALVNDTMYKNALKIGREIAAAKHSQLSLASQNLSQDELKSIHDYAKKYYLPSFLISNLTLAAAAFKVLMPSASLAGVLNGLGALDLAGRAQRLGANLYVDVGHNELGAQALFDKFKNTKLSLIYNSFADKDYRLILRTFAPILLDVKVYEYASGNRELVGFERIKDECKTLGISCSRFTGADMSHIRAELSGAFGADTASMPAHLRLVFGSFHLVQEFLKELNASKDL